MTRKLSIDKTYNDTADKRPAGNSGFAKKRVQWLIEHSTSHQHLCYVDTLVLRNPLLRKAAKRYLQAYGDSTNIGQTQQMTQANENNFTADNP